MKIDKMFEEFKEFNDRLNLKDLGPAVSIFGGARIKPDNEYYKAAMEIGYKLGTNGYSIITGGGPGIMEAGNKGAQAADSNSVGLVISLPFEAVDNPHIDGQWNVKFEYFFPRKVAFVSNSDAFVVMPGGVGTLDELFEVLTLIQCKKIKRVPIVLYGKDFWTPMLNMLVNMAIAGTISYTDLDLLTITDNVDEVVNTIKSN